MADAREAPTGELVPDVVRQALLGVAAQVLGSVPPGEAPAALRQVQRFAPRRRATAGAAPLWTALTSDDGFRARVAAAWSQARPALAERLSAADPPPAEDLESAVEAAVGAFLTRPDGWQRAIDVVAPMLAARDAERAASIGATTSIARCHPSGLVKNAPTAASTADSRSSAGGGSAAESRSASAGRA